MTYVSATRQAVYNAHDQTGERETRVSASETRDIRWALSHDLRRWLNDEATRNLRTDFSSADSRVFKLAGEAARQVAKKVAQDPTPGAAQRAFDIADVAHQAGGDYFLIRFTNVLREELDTLLDQQRDPSPTAPGQPPSLVGVEQAMLWREQPLSNTYTAQDYATRRAQFALKYGENAPEPSTPARNPTEGVPPVILHQGLPDLDRDLRNPRTAAAALELLLRHLERDLTPKKREALDQATADFRKRYRTYLKDPTDDHRASLVESFDGVEDQVAGILSPLDARNQRNRAALPLINQVRQGLIALSTGVFSGLAGPIVGAAAGAIYAETSRGIDAHLNATGERVVTQDRWEDGITILATAFVIKANNWLDARFHAHWDKIAPHASHAALTVKQRALETLGHVGVHLVADNVAEGTGETVKGLVKEEGKEEFLDRGKDLGRLTTTTSVGSTAVVETIVALSKGKVKREWLIGPAEGIETFARRGLMQRNEDRREAERTKISEKESEKEKPPEPKSALANALQSLVDPMLFESARLFAEYDNLPSLRQVNLATGLHSEAHLRQTLPQSQNNEAFWFVQNSTELLEAVNLIPKKERDQVIKTHLKKNGLE